MVTELKPELKKLPFEDFVNVMCRPMVSEAALREEVKEVFGHFAGAGNTAITAASLQEVMSSLDHPVSKLLVCVPLRHPRTHVPTRSWPAHPLSRPASRPPPLSRPAPVQSEEMIREADLDRDGKIGLEDFMRTVVL